MESFGQVQCGLVKRQPMDGGPQIEHVALRRARTMEALEDLLVERNGERMMAISGLTMNRARTTPLSATSLQMLQPVQMAEHLLHRDLLAELSIVDPHTRSGNRRHRRVDRGLVGVY